MNFNFKEGDGMTMKTLRLKLVLASLLFALGACGGGGGSNTARTGDLINACKWDSSTWDKCNWGA